jgi:hypothetical protein
LFWKEAFSYRSNINNEENCDYMQASGHIHNTPFSSHVTNGHNKLVCYVKMGWKGLPWPNTLAYWAQPGYKENEVL